MNKRRTSSRFTPAAAAPTLSTPACYLRRIWLSSPFAHALNTPHEQALNTLLTLEEFLAR